MSPRYQVLWTPVAQMDLESVVSLISKNNGSIALKIFRTIRLKASLLYQYPQRGRLIPELSHIAEFSFRELVIPPWRLIYRIKQKRVEILAFFDGRRDLSEILFERISRIN